MTMGTSLKTLVLLCADLENLGRGLDLEEVREWLQGTLPAVDVQLAPDLSRRPAELVEAVAISGAERLVLGLCREQRATAQVQAQVRKAGLDPLGVEMVNLGTHAALMGRRARATEKAKILLAAAVARVRAFPGSRPDNAKPYLPAKVSRRSLFSLPLLEYRPAPSIQKDLCSSGTGCELCVQVCCKGALVRAHRQVRVEKSRCESCGLCLTACPREAIEFPGYAPAQLVAEITTLLDPTVGTLQPRGISFICQRSARVLERLVEKGFPPVRSKSLGSNSEVELLPVQVPCLGMVPPTWLLACLTLGAAAVTLVTCPGQCPLAQKEVIGGRVAYCQELLRTLGGSPERIRLLQPTDKGTPGFTFQIGMKCEVDSRESGTLNLFPTQVLLQLVQDHQASEGLFLAHPHSPFGVIEVTDGCTGCGVCAATCPTAALALERADGRVSLTFDAALCTACGQCLPRCPEARKPVLHLRRVTDLQRLFQGRVALYHDRDTRCEACGAPFAPEAMLRRVGPMLGGEKALAFGLISRYCPDCRGWFT